jgi:hypothetical protein
MEASVMGSHCPSGEFMQWLHSCSSSAVKAGVRGDVADRPLAQPWARKPAKRSNCYTCMVQALALIPISGAIQPYQFANNLVENFYPDSHLVMNHRDNPCPWE